MKIEEVPSAKGGKMNTELKNAVLATDLKAQYDACAKKLIQRYTGTNFDRGSRRISGHVTGRSEAID